MIQIMITDHLGNHVKHHVQAKEREHPLKRRMGEEEHLMHHS